MPNSEASICSELFQLIKDFLNNDIKWVFQWPFEHNRSQLKHKIYMKKSAN